MKMFLLSNDKDTLTGMRLTGVDGKIIGSAAELEEAYEQAVLSGDIGILLITKTLADLFPEKVIEMKKKAKLLVTEIPDMKNPSGDSDSITRYVREAVGIKI